jgi:hypothetical protein
MRASLSLLTMCCAVASTTATAQRMEQRFPPVQRATAAALPDSTSRPREALRVGGLHFPRRDSSWWVPLTSTVLPGAGQALLGQDRFVAYFAVEGYVIFDYLKVSAQQRDERTRSRVLARDIARAVFGGPRPVGEWGYYESMEKYIESGVFDRVPVPGGELSPEVDPTTFNGTLWLDVRQRYWNDPNVEPAHSSKPYIDALNEYKARAVRDEFRWSWRNAQLEQDIYRRSIRRENQAAHMAAALVNALVVNRLLSTVDAFITLRVRTGNPAAGDPASLSATIPWAPFGRPERP